ncbi:hypothetical protein MUP79_08505 [Candidatus Bathyarchaeota archaeon]|nr:hypothetical protein [Candidatus Bathyarchaeota archaeon]
MENALRAAYRLAEKRRGEDLGLAGLLDWAEKRFNLSKGEVGHAIWLLRNELMHEDRLVNDPEALQALKHVSLVLIPIQKCLSPSHAQRVAQLENESL